MHHRPELTGLDAAQDLLGSAIEDVVVILDEVPTGILRALRQCLEFTERRSDRLFHDDMGSSVESIHRQSEMRCRGRGDVDDVRLSLFQHLPVIGKPALDSIPLGGGLCRGRREVADGRHLDARQTLQAGEMLPGDLPCSDECYLHERTSSTRR